MRPIAMRLTILLAAATTAAATALVGAGSAVAAPSAADTTFMTANAQTNLAEQAIGAIALEKGQSAEVRELATMTVADHKKAMDQLTAVAQTLDATLPSAPNEEQQQQAATLKAASAGEFDALYAQIQVMGHTKSIAATNTELSTGSDASVLAYAKGYLPVVQMHLTLAQNAVGAVEMPGSVPAGTGGQADASASTSMQTVFGALGVALLIGAGALYWRQRRAA